MLFGRARSLYRGYVVLYIIYLLKIYVLLLQTTDIEKVMLKSSPILISSYYLMFSFCLNGQQMTDKVNNERTVLHYFAPLTLALRPSNLST